MLRTITLDLCPVTRAIAVTSGLLLPLGGVATAEAERAVEHALAGVSGMEITTIAADIKFLSSEGDKVVATLRDDDGKDLPEDLRPMARLKDGKLEIFVEGEDRGARGWSLFGRHPDLELIVKLPKTPALELSVRSTSGDIDMPEMVVKNLDLRTTSGEFDADCLRAAEGTVVIETISGDVEIEKCLTAREARVRTTSGDVKAKGDVARIEVETVSGEVELSDLSGAAKVRTTSGDIRVSQQAVPEIAAKTTSGDIKVKIPTAAEVAITATTKSGELHIPGLDASKGHRTARIDAGKEGSGKLDLESTSGDVRIERR